MLEPQQATGAGKMSESDRDRSDIDRADIDRPDTDTEDIGAMGRPTAEVSSEGGSPGDVETHTSQAPASGTEATETWQPGHEQVVEIRRDETGVGRRSP
jgi:hypothetical protein